MNPSTAASQDVGMDATASRLWWFAILFQLPVIMFVVAYPLDRHSGQLVDIGKLAQYQPAALAAYLLGLTAMFVLYILALRLVRGGDHRGAVGPVVGGGIVSAVAMAAMYPVNAIDLFIYTVRSRIFTSHGENPLAVTPSQFPDDPLMAFASAEWSVTVSPYGPLWNLIAAPITALSGDNLLAALVGFKALAVVSVLVGAWLIGKIRRAAGLPVTAGVLFYLWNPLVLWEGIGNGHNDTVMMVPVLAAMLAWTRGRDRLVLPLLVVAVCIKYVAVVAVPVALVAIWRRQPSPRHRLEVLAISGLGAALVVAVSLIPFFDLWAIWSSLTAQGTIFLTSPAAVALTVLDDVIERAAARELVTITGAGLMALWLVFQLVRVWRRPPSFPSALYETLFVFLLVATWNFRVWYLIWLVAVAAILPLGWPAWRAVAWTAGGLAGYALFIWVWHWWPVEFPTIQAVGVAVLTGPAVIVTLIQLVRTARGQWISDRRPLPHPPPG